MKRDEKPERQFSLGDIVYHREWGVGQVLEEAKEDSQKGILIDFPGKVHHRMSFEVASRALSRLPPNGLEALLLRESDMVMRWSRSAPLKLIAVALVDLGGAAKTANLRRKLERLSVLGMKWQSWWKRVQPVVKQSPHFRVYFDGTYQLASAVEDIPESPLPPSPKRSRVTRLNAVQLAAVASRLEAGEIEFESLKDAKSLRLVAKELVWRSATSEKAQAVINKAIAGSVLPARILLKELSESAQPEKMADALIHFMNNIEHLATCPAKGKKIGEHVVAKARLLEDTVKDYVVEHDLDLWQPQIPLVTKVALQLGLAIWRREMSSWRSECLDRLCKAVAILGEKQLNVFEVAGDYLASGDENIAGRLAVTDSLLAKVAPDIRLKVVNQLLLSALTGTTQFIEQCFSRHLTREQQLSWVSSALSRVLSSCDAHALTTLAKLLRRSMPDLEAEQLRAYVELAITAASVNPQAQADLLLVIQESLSKCFGDMAIEARELTMESGQKTVLDSIEAAYKGNLKKAKEKAESQHMRLEAASANLRTALEAAKAESMRMKELNEQLKSSYHLPEQWAAFEGSKKVLQAIVELHQEAFLAEEAGAVDVKSISWILRRLEITLQGFGVSMQDQTGKSEIYNPAFHEYVPGSKREGNQVRIVCPAFEWQDPAGNKMLLARAKVVGC